MARDIRKFLNSTYVKCSNSLRKREVIQVYVEGELDKVFWYYYLHPYEKTYNCSFRISILQDRHKILNGKASLLYYKQKSDLGHNMWLCVDSDYDEVIKDYSEFSQRIKEDQYVITTYWYSLESLKCTPNLLEMDILKASLADKCDANIDEILRTISTLYKSMFLLLLEMEDKHDGNFKINDFSKCLSYVSFKDEKLDVVSIKAKIANWKKVNSKLFEKYGKRFNYWIAKLKAMGFEESDYYHLFYGHGLYEHVAVPLVRFYAQKYRADVLTSITNGADKKDRKASLVKEYYNNTFTSSDKETLTARVKQLISDNNPNMDNFASRKIMEQIETALRQ